MNTFLGHIETLGPYFFRKVNGINFSRMEVPTPDEDFLEYENKIDLIFAGFPCQGFSNAGKKKLNDPRNTLFREFARFSKIIKKDWKNLKNI